MLEGYSPIPAPLARRLALTGPAKKWLRRLYTRPDTGQLVTMETTARLFTAGQQAFIRLADQTCRTPYCGAPIRHCDHVTPKAQGGATALHNGQGLCEACNQAKEAPGLAYERHPDGSITVTTPSGRRYTSRSPDPPGAGSGRAAA
jgi:hypothetical protein